MAKIIGVCAFLLAAFLLLMLFGNNDQPSGDNPKTVAGSYKPSAFMQSLGTIASLFAPSVELNSRQFKPSPGNPVLVEIPRQKTDGMALKLHLSQGSAAIAHFQAASPCQPDLCVQSLCLAQNTTPPPPGCDAAFTKAIDGSLAVMRAGGKLTIEAPAGLVVVDAR